MSPCLAGQILVIAKAPVPGLVKTRLSPPCTPVEAAALAAAALADTLAAVRATPVRRRVLAYDRPGEPASDKRPGEWPGGRRGDRCRADHHPVRTGKGGPVEDRPPVDLRGLDVIPQRGDGLGQRIANAFADAATGSGHGLPTLLVGMDTPQLTPGLLRRAFDVLAETDAVLGRAPDGGWWALGLNEPERAGVLATVPMSREDTALRTEAALLARGIRILPLSELPDVDTFTVALEVAAATPQSRFARALADLTARTAS